MKSRHLIWVFLATGAVGCGSQFDDPTEVARLYWTSLADRDVSEARRFSTLSTVSDVELPDVDYEVQHIQLVVAAVEGDEASVATTVEVTIAGVDVNLEFNTAVVKMDNKWLIDAEITNERLAASALQGVLSGSLAGSMDQLQGALAELGGSLDGLGDMVGEIVGQSMEGILDGLADASARGRGSRSDSRNARRRLERATARADRAAARADRRNGRGSLDDGWQGINVNELPEAVVSLTHVGNGETRSDGFTLTRAGDVQILAIGEGTSQMYDYGWILDADSRERVWTMELGNTQHAGGREKNRMVNETISLDAGNYEVYYASDDSYSVSDNWSGGSMGAAPDHDEYWGITVMPANGARLRPYDVRSEGLRVGR